MIWTIVYSFHSFFEKCGHFLNIMNLWSFSASFPNVCFHFISRKGSNHKNSFLLFFLLKHKEHFILHFSRWLSNLQCFLSSSFNRWLRVSLTLFKRFILMFCDIIVGIDHQFSSFFSRKRRNLCFMEFFFSVSQETNYETKPKWSFQRLKEVMFSIKYNWMSFSFLLCPKCSPMFYLEHIKPGSECQICLFLSFPEHLMNLFPSVGLK